MALMGFVNPVSQVTRVRLAARMGIDQPPKHGIVGCGGVHVGGQGMVQGCM